MKFISIFCYYVFRIASTLAEKERSFSDYDSIFNNLNEHSESNFQKYDSLKVDFLKEDDYSAFELADIIHLSELSIEKDIDAYSNLEIMTIVDHHNIYRSNFTKPIPEGSNVEYVQWNDTLAWAANDWSKQCQFEHSYGYHDNMTHLQGQNLYRGPSMLPSRAIFLWYEEYRYFSFKDFACTLGLLECGHMTQVLWSDSSRIGCARTSKCWPHEKLIMVNCHYFRKQRTLGKFGIGNQIYKYGQTCTRCNLADGNLCYRGLCVTKNMCNDYKLDCECKLNCKNCVKPNPKKCRCEPCKLGWDWEDCSFPCVDLYDVVRHEVGSCRQRAELLCSYDQVAMQCTKTCGRCKPLNLNDTENLCCDGKMCPLYHVLDEECNCVKDCPSPLCLYPPPTTKKPSVLEPKPFSTVVAEESRNESFTPHRKQQKLPPSKSIENAAIFNALIMTAISVLLLWSCNLQT